MVSRKGKALIGAFVLGAIALLCVAVVLLGSGSYNTKRTSFVLYFDSTLRGLTVGSAVYYNGVRIGRVTSLEITTEKEEVVFRTPVIIELEEPQRLVGGHKNEDSSNLLEYLSDEQTVRTLIENGLRAKLSTLSFITGLLVIDLAMEPNANPVNWQDLKPYHDIPQLPTVSSGLENILSQFAELPIKQVSENLVQVLEKINLILESVENENLVANVGKSIETLNVAAAQYSELAKVINGNLENVFNNIDVSFAELNRTMKSVDEVFIQSNQTLLTISQAVESGEEVLNPNSSVMQEIMRTMISIQGAANGVTSFTRLLSRNPDALIFGKGR